MNDLQVAKVQSPASEKQHAVHVPADEQTALLISFVAPCHNEEANVERLVIVLEQVWASLRSRFSSLQSWEIVLVDDGSTDGTWALIQALSASRQHIRGIKLSRNFGHQAALTAGLHAATGDMVVSLDADLQDDVSVIPKMVLKHLEGAEIVFGVRNDRSSDSFFKRTTAVGYYRLLTALGVSVVHNHADYRLMGRKSLEALRRHSERNLYLRGLISSFGFRTAEVPYARQARKYGQTSYSLRRMLLLALDGVTSFSIRPLRYIFYIGFFISLFSACYIIFALFGALLGLTVPGWTSLVVSIYLIGGIQIMGIGILGEYIGRIYLETKQRPAYLVDEMVPKAKFVHGNETIATGADLPDRIFAANKFE
jgi:glycosyltransferase involved in cell wall biosynthesis